MNLTANLDYLVNLRAEIGDLRVVKCRMLHERVVRAKNSGLPVAEEFPADSYRRIGFCQPETRARRIGCGHTMARYKLQAAIDELASPNADDLKEKLSLELSRLTNEIHLLDHRKGDAEKSLARALEKAYFQNDTAVLKLAEAEISSVEILHDDCIDRIGALRDEILAALDEEIRRLRQTSNS